MKPVIYDHAKEKRNKNSCLTQGGVLIKMDQQYVLTLEMLQVVVFFSAAKECLIIVASPVLTTEHLCSHVHSCTLFQNAYTVSNVRKYCTP